MSFITAALMTGQRRVSKAQGAHSHSRKISWRGLTIGVENDVGSVRRGVGPEGPWETRMSLPYGEILGSLGVDGDPLDTFVIEAGLDSASHVYVIHTANPKTGWYDEDKCIIGAGSREEAILAFAAHYDDPGQHWGAITAIEAAAFARRCTDKAQHGKAFTTQTEARVRLGQRAVRRARQSREEHVDWMRALVSKAQGIRQVTKGLNFSDLEAKIADLESQVKTLDEAPIDWDDIDHRPELEYQLGLLRYARAAWINGNPVSKALMPAPDEDLYIRIWPGKNALDLQGEVIPVDLIYASWSYYVECGNVDLEHISKMGGKSWREKSAKIEAAGFEPGGVFGRVQYEIGRPIPVPGSLRAEEFDENGRVLDFSFVAKIHGGGNAAANWFRTTLPDIPWKPSVGGQMSDPVEVVTEITDPRLGIKARKQKIKVARDFRWNNVAMTLEPVQHWVRPIQILGPDEVAELLSISKSVE